jgi:putative tricarboxylic transport membrane protein
MLDLNLLLAGFATVFHPSHLIVLILGTIGGIIVGALPGLTATMAIALLIPFTFSMGPTAGICMLLAVYTAGIYGGGIASILIRTPGTPAAVVTVLDGYPMAQKGLAGQALGLATVGSGIGGLFSAICLALFAPILAAFALRFSAPEYFALAVLGLSVTVTMTGRSPLKGAISATAGLLICMVGLDPIGGFPRFTFGTTELVGGISFVPMLIGLFSLSEAFRQIEIIEGVERVTAKIGRVVPRIGEIIIHKWTMLRACLIGIVVGIMPSMGPETAAFMSYSETKRTSDHPEEFGKGEPGGVVAAQTAENASTGGDVLPMITLGVPGDAATAVLMGALTIHNLEPGPLLFRDHAGVVHTIFAAMIVANISFLIIGLFGARYFAKVLNVDRRLLVPAIVLFSLVGAYALNNNGADVWVCLIFGIVGYLMQRYDFPVSPMVLAMILGAMAESNFRRSLAMSQGDPIIFFSRPIACAILILAVLAAVSAVRRQLALSRQTTAAAG